jgi:hypothetical protein
LEHQAVKEFCRKNGATLEDFLRTADELNLNIALVDDLVELDQKAEEISSEDHDS